jgi:hypothetical protein
MPNTLMELLMEGLPQLLKAASNITCMDTTTKDIYKQLALQ